MKLRNLLCLTVVPLLGACAATTDYFSYSYVPPGSNDPQATISGKSTGDISLIHVDEKGCYMGTTRILRSTATEKIHAGKMVFFSQEFSPTQRSACTVTFAFVPKDKGVYEISSETTERFCTSQIVELSGSERTVVRPKKVISSKAGLTACLKMYAG